MFAGNNLLLQSLLTAQSQLPIRPQPQPTIDPFTLTPSPPASLDFQNMLMMLQEPALSQLFFNNIMLNSLTPQLPPSPQLYNHNPISVQMLFRQPGFLNLLSHLTGAPTAEITEVPDERHEKLREKISPEPLTHVQQPAVVQSRKRVSSTSPNHPTVAKKSKAFRKLHNADAETNSPVSGMFIKDAWEMSADDLSKACELDETAACVEITEESKKKIAEIPNVIGKSKCSLCKREFPDVFRLAMHRCPRIIHANYECPECQKVFSCPANLASHQRWHQPRNSTTTCNDCLQSFETKKSFREHKCPQKMGASSSSRNSITSIVTASSSPGTSFVDSSTAVSPSELPSVQQNSPQPALISLGLNTNSLTIADLHEQLRLKLKSPLKEE